MGLSTRLAATLRLWANQSRHPIDPQSLRAYNGRIVFEIIQHRMYRLLAAIFFLSLAACNGSAGTPSSDSPGGTSISDIQGEDVASPLAGQTVTVEGIVTGDFQDNDLDVANNLGGFFLQAENPDASAMTSDGIFVFDGDEPHVDVSVGDRVSITGAVKEHFGETQIAGTSVTARGVGTVQTTDVTLPAAGIVNNSDGQEIADLEKYEGMLIRFDQTLTVGDLYGLERFGEVGLSQGGRLYQFSNRNAPDVAAYTLHRETMAARSIMLDDGRRGQGEVPVRYLRSSDAFVRVGSSVAGLTGVLRYSRGSGGSGMETWRLMATAEPEFVADNSRPGAPVIDGELRIASANVLNFFSTIDSGQDVCGPRRTSGCRGAGDEEELARQLAKTTTALAMIDADIVGLMELENNASESLQSIVTSLNDTMGADTYAFVNTGSIGYGAIKTGFIFKTASVSPSGPHAILTESTDARFKDGRNRPALAQTFVQNRDGAKLTIVVNHLKSKGSSCDGDGDPNINDGQGNCNQTRAAAAAAIADWLKKDPTTSNDPDFLVIGDLNADLREDPLTAFANAGFKNLLEVSPDASPYSYVFRGQTGVLDHALVSESLLSQVAGTMEWHVNADETPIHDYNLNARRDPMIFDGTNPYRFSDHDPVVIGLNLSN